MKPAELASQRFDYAAVGAIKTPANRQDLAGVDNVYAAVRRRNERSEIPSCRPIARKVPASDSNELLLTAEDRCFFAVTLELRGTEICTRIKFSLSFSKATI